jgi:hypothetical protein
MICDLVAKKNINLHCGSFTGKVFTETCYHERAFIAFKMKEQCFGHIHDIVCRNRPKFGTCVHCWMASNVADQRFRHVSQKKPLSIFQVVKIAFFVKRLPRKSSKMAPIHFLHIVDIISCTITKRHAFPSSLPISGHLYDFLPIQEETTRF